MGKKKREKFVRMVHELANERGLRVGFLIISDGDATSGFTTYRNSDDAWEGMTILKNLLKDIESRDSE